MPFKANLQQLFEDKNFFKANEKLHLYHRNISWRYGEILNRTNELLVKLYLASDKYHQLGKKLSEDNYYIVFEAEDLQILKRADALLSNPSKWNKNDDNNCDSNSAMRNYSLDCALKSASQEMVGEWEDEPYSPAIRLVLRRLLEDENRRYVIDMVEEWNNHPDTTFEDVKNLLSACIEVVENQISSND